MHGPGTLEARLRYLDGTYEVLQPGAYVLCAVTGRRIPIEELRYWNVARQEAYADPLIALQALRGKPTP
jgi:hypothetical protein